MFKIYFSSPHSAAHELIQKSRDSVQLSYGTHILKKIQLGLCFQNMWASLFQYLIFFKNVLEV